MSLRDYLTILYQRKWVVLPIVVAVLAAALVYSALQTPSYRAQAQVLLSRQDASSALSGAAPANPEDAARESQTQADLARVPAVVRATLETAKVPISIGAFLDQSSVTSSPNSDLIEFTVNYRTPTGARRLVNAYAGEFVRYRKSLDTASLRRARRGVEERLNDLSAAGQESSAIYQKLASKSEELRVLLALQTSHAVVVRTASSASRTQPNVARNGFLAAIVGLMLGVGIALVWNAIDTRPRSALEIAANLELPLLGRLPEAPPNIRKKNRLVMLAEPDGAAAEPFRMLRANLDLVGVDKQFRSIMVVSATQEEGKSTTIANLAVTAARAGRRVVLMDLDLRRGDLDDLFGVADSPGITDVVLGELSLAEARVSIDVHPEEAASEPDRRSRTAKGSSGSLHVLPVGTPPPDPGDFVLSETVAGMARQLAYGVDLVLVDAPPLLQTGDAMAISRLVDAVAVVVKLGIGRSALDELGRTLQPLPAAKLGVVVTGDDFGQSQYAGYYGSIPRGEATSSKVGDVPPAGPAGQ
jgi:Mrp family chromosome partitioning ATPase/capsular polysaccharide biosynthesis protein